MSHCAPLNEINAISRRLQGLCHHPAVVSVQLNDTTAAMPSELETAMESLITVFHRYASREGRNGTLSRRELRELMENELTNFLKVGQAQTQTFPRRSSSCFHVDITFIPLSFRPSNSVPEGPRSRGQNHEGLGHQR